MPFNFSGIGKQSVAKPGVVSDGELFTVNDGLGLTVTSTLSSFTAFLSNPVRSATGVWSVTMRDSAFKVCDFEVHTVLPSGVYLSTQLNTITTDSNGRPVLNWTFNSAGTPADLPASGSPQFIVYFVYGETSIA